MDSTSDSLVDGADGQPHGKVRVGHKTHPIMYWTGLVLVLIALVISGVTGGYVEYRNGQIHHIHVRNLDGAPTVGVDASTENILMIGSTNRCVLNGKQSAAFGACGQGGNGIRSYVNGINSDVVMVLRVDPKTQRLSVLSIPRDTFLPNARPNEYNKIDSALVYGPGQLVAAVEQDLGITIQHYVELNFDSFQNVVKDLGGLKMWFPDPVYDSKSGLKVTKAGCVNLGAFQALAVVRARHMYYEVKGTWYYDGSGDLGRIIRDHEFLRVLASTVMSHGLSNPFYVNQLIGDVAPQLTVDQSFTPHEMEQLILEMRHIKPYRVPETTLPIINVGTTYYQYKGFDYGAIVFPAEPNDLAAVTSWLGHPVPGTKVSPSKITVSVLGGVGDPTETAAVAGKLKALGFDVIGTGEQTPVGPTSEASVLYKNAAALPDGNRVLETLSGAVSLGQNKTLDNADVTVVTGTNFSVDSPHTAATTLSELLSPATSGHGGTPAPLGNPGLAVAPITSQPVILDPPTPASQGLPSYDPRACPSTSKSTKKSKH